MTLYVIITSVLYQLLKGSLVMILLNVLNICRTGSFPKDTDRILLIITNADYNR